MFVPALKNQLFNFTAILGIVLFSSLPLGVFTHKLTTFEIAYAAPVTASNLIELTNQARLENGLNTLKVSSLLIQSAQLKSNDMLEKGYFAHTSPEGLSPWYWFGLVGYDYIYAGENLAKNYASAESMFAAWMDSPTHRANILSENYLEIGIAVVQNSQVLYVTQHFGSPKNVSAGSTVTNPTPLRPAAQVASDTTPPVIEDVPLVKATVEQGEEIPVALNVSGDPVKVTVRAGDKEFALAQEKNKWIGTIVLYAGGTYTVTAKAEDAAGNSMTLSLGEVTVAVPGIVRHDQSLKLMVAAYWRDVAANEGWPVSLALVMMVAVLIGARSYAHLQTRVKGRFAVLLSPLMRSI